MSSINEAKRLIKRIILTNIISENIYMTPLLSGKHGIGKSAIMKQVSKDIKADFIVIEGGTLKEGEITGLPYQYQNKDKIEFKFLPYYAIKQIQEKEEKLNLKNNLSNNEKLSLLKDNKVTPTIIFIDELNRTDHAVYRELMNILLTKTVNGYKLPWWVFFTSAVNPCDSESLYATNEMDPAQLDRFIKIKVQENLEEFLNYSINKNFDQTIINFLSNHGIYLSDSNMSLEDTETSLPSPRGWEMVNYLFKSKDLIKEYFTKEELQHEDEDIKTLMASKVGNIAAAAYESSLNNPIKLVTAEDIFKYNEEKISSNIINLLKNQSTAMNSITNQNVLNYLITNYDEDNLKYNKKLHNKVKEYMDYLDSSSKLVFAELLTNNNTIKNTSLYDEFYYLFDEKFINMIYKTIDNERLLTNG